MQINFEKIKFITKFIDEVLSNNAEAWDDSKPFMSANKLSNKWVADLMTKGPTITQKFNQAQKIKKTTKTISNQGVGGWVTTLGGGGGVTTLEHIFPDICANVSISTCAHSKKMIRVQPLGTQL
jgi:hypothetical protein